MNWHNKMFYHWMIIASMSVFLQYISPEHNLGIVVAVLMIPIFIHDILINIIAEKRRKAK